MSAPRDPADDRPPERDESTLGVFTPHSANEGDHGADAWLAEVLPTDEHEIVHGEHRDDHIPRGFRDLSGFGWVAVVLMAVVLSLIIWGLVLPAMGVTRMWTVNPLG